MSAPSADLLLEVRAFRAQHPAIRYVDLIALDIPGHFYGKRYPIDMLEKVVDPVCRRGPEQERLGNEDAGVHQDQQVMEAGKDDIGGHGWLRAAGCVDVPRRWSSTKP